MKRNCCGQNYWWQLNFESWNKTNENFCVVSFVTSLANSRTSTWFISGTSKHITTRREHISNLSTNLGFLSYRFIVNVKHFNQIRTEHWKEHVTSLTFVSSALAIWSTHFHWRWPRRNPGVSWVNILAVAWSLFTLKSEQIRMISRFPLLFLIPHCRMFPSRTTRCLIHSYHCHWKHSSLPSRCSALLLALSPWNSHFVSSWCNICTSAFPRQFVNTLVLSSFLRGSHNDTRVRSFVSPLRWLHRKREDLWCEVPRQQQQLLTLDPWRLHSVRRHWTVDWMKPLLVCLQFSDLQIIEQWNKVRSISRHFQNPIHFPFLLPESQLLLAFLNDGDREATFTVFQTKMYGKTFDQKRQNEIFFFDIA